MGPEMSWMAMGRCTPPWKESRMLMKPPMRTCCDACVAFSDSYSAYVVSLYLGALASPPPRRDARGLGASGTQIFVLSLAA
jgi:hypothetical protein